MAKTITKYFCIWCHKESITSGKCEKCNSMLLKKWW